ncbi:MAG TPA: CRISPR-associated endonuclease Cas1 [Oscillatoriaceae cyanobacterium M33_DOE_052]|uniref:CRISPR-associated endonuclease Cas1 n=1 Tax=Planktothricoides sp. SpSt-374 TaxID=2282167 RepID=A0A7C3ZLX1_9CYAN|nr:CRISPR-associated endonuclease Cas1 [Oscillatoriaceae cyanobacterium M33_DOE_052]
MTAIYLTKSGVTLTAKGRVFELWYREQLQSRVQAKMTSHIVAFAGCSVAPAAAALASSHCLPLLFLDAAGRYVGRLPLTSPAKYLPLQQQRANDGEFVLTTALGIVNATLHSRLALLAMISGHSCSRMGIAIREIESRREQIATGNLETLRGNLAAVNQLYYPLLRRWLWRHTGWENDFLDNLFHFHHALLEQIIYGFVLEWGLAPEIANLHVGDGDKLPLVQDLMLEWSASLIDTLVMRFALTHHSLFTNGNGHCQNHWRDNCIAAWEQQLKTIITGDKSLRQLLWHQVGCYCQALWGDTSYHQKFLVGLQPKKVRSWASALRSL